MDTRYCQSCGMPMDEDHFQFTAKEKDGTDSPYCTYCYRDGEFTEPDATLEDVVELGVPHLARKIGEQAAREELTHQLRMLKRWRV